MVGTLRTSSSFVLFVLEAVRLLGYSIRGQSSGKGRECRMVRGSGAELSAWVREFGGS
jgi:hypothetical protein